LAFRHRDRLEGGVAIPRDLQFDFPDVGGDGLGIGAIAAVARPPPSDRVRLIAEMLGELDLQAGLQHLADQRRQQPVLAGQLHPLTAGSSDQLISPVPHGRLITHQRDDTRRSCRLGRRQRRCCSPCRSHRSDPLQPATLSRGPSDHAGYTKFLTVPRPRHRPRRGPISGPDHTQSSSLTVHRRGGRYVIVIAMTSTAEAGSGRRSVRRRKPTAAQDRPCRVLVGACNMGYRGGTAGVVVDRDFAVRCDGRVR
jgi:hypothetical protein